MKRKNVRPPYFEFVGLTNGRSASAQRHEVEQCVSFEACPESLSILLFFVSYVMNVALF